jgi:uncharacterized membrane protein
VQPLAFEHLRESLRTSLWFIPAVCVVLAIATAMLTGWIDDRVDAGFPSGVLFSSSPESARSFLTTISASMITFTGLVFSITIVVLQLASGQFSPRVLRTFLRDRLSQLSLGIFVATFTYSLVVLRHVRSAGEVEGLGASIPRISTATAFVLVLVSVGFFIYYINHMAQSIRVSHIIASVGHETRKLFTVIYDHADVTPASLEDHPSGEPDGRVRAPETGVVLAFDRDGLVAVAAEHGGVIEIIPKMGDFIPRGAVLYETYGFTVADDDLLEHVDLGTERTMQQDPAFGFRQLVDIAERALSPAINDPTTAVQALDQIHDLLRNIAPLEFPNGERRDASGALRVVFRVMSWEEYVDLAVDEIRHFGARSIQVVKRLRSMLFDLKTVALPERQAVLEEQLALIDEAVTRQFPDPPDVDRAKRT